MSFKLRKLVAESISEFIKPDIKNHYYLLSHIPNILELKKCRKTNSPELHLPIIKTRNLFQNYESSLLQEITTKMKYDKNYINEITMNSTDLNRTSTIIFKLNPYSFTKDAFNIDETKNLDRPSEKIVVEFSSPNIAKPFHVGHLRSTIIGNFIGNLNKALGNEVIKLNYLGDWGTQFGLLQIGVEMIGLSDEQIQENPIQSLYQAYVTANQAAKSDPNISEAARKIFKNLESGQVDMRRWEKFRKYTVDELRKVYYRLGVDFDQYDWESQYNQNDIKNVLEKLEKEKLLFNDDDGRKIALVGDRRVPVIKSDGSTLYLARDIAALLDRFDRYKFARIFYVVDNAQTDHFNACFTITKGIQKNLENKVNHIKFGRIKGMSTRQGNVVFLQDVLDEAKEIMMEKQIQSPTTKVNINNLESNVADILGISAVIVNDLKQRRQKDYEFSWDKVLQVNGDTGIKLQYTHCRLCSLSEKNTELEKAEQVNLELLRDAEAQNLILEIARYPEILLKAEESLEACILVNYLFSLCNATSRALKTLNIKNEKSTEIQSQRLLLFETSRTILNRGMKILGLHPLNKM